jgi:chemotaxis signal transduction protein
MGQDDLLAYERYCILRKGDSWFAVPAMAVREVSSCDMTIPIPQSPPVLAGLCHLRDEFLPVLQLRDLAGDESTKANQGGQLLVISGQGGPWALMVDQVVGLDSLEVSLDSDVRVPNGWTAAVMGSATYRDQVVRVLDPNRLYRLAEEELQSEWSIGQLKSDIHQGANR